MSFRLIVLILALSLSACGSESDAPATPTGDGPASGTSAVEVNAVTDDPAIRQRLTPAHLVVYAPEAFGERAAGVRSQQSLRDGATGDGPATSSASIQYTGYINGVPSRIDLLIQDMIDDPRSLEAKRRQIETGEGIGFGTAEPKGESHRIANGIARSHVITETSPWLYVLLADRFAITMNAEGRGAILSPEDLLALYRSSGLGQLAGAPVHAEASEPTVPTWASAAVEAWRNASGDGAEDTPPPSSETVAAITPLPDCERLLSAADVEQQCSVSSVRIVVTDFEDEGKNCNRVYKVGDGPSSGLVFLATRYGSPDPARRAMAMASEESPYAVEHALLEDLGAGGYREKTSSDTTPDRYEVKFWLNNVLVEMNNRDSPFDQPDQKLCLSLDDMEALARGIADRLTE